MWFSFSYNGPRVFTRLIQARNWIRCFATIAYRMPSEKLNERKLLVICTYICFGSFAFIFQKYKNGKINVCTDRVM